MRYVIKYGDGLTALRKQSSPFPSALTQLFRAEKTHVEPGPLYRHCLM
jgi:hypothetical protein